MITFSALDLLVECQYWARPEAADIVGYECADADDGTEFHALIESHLLGKAVDPPPETADRFTGWVDSWTERYPDGVESILVEAAFALNVRTGESSFLGESIDRQYPDDLGPDWICGTVDVAMLYRGVCHVPDHKTGTGAQITGNIWSAVTPAARNRQLSACAYCAAKHLGATEAVVEIHHVQESGAIDADVAFLDALDLACVPDDIAALMDKAAAAKPRSGDWCTQKFCRQLTECPAVRDSAGQLAPITDLTANIVSPQQLLKAIDALPRASRILKTVKQAMERYCEESGGRIELPDGRAFRAVENKGRVSVNAKAVREDHGDKYDRTGPGFVTYKTVGKKAV